MHVSVNMFGEIRANAVRWSLPIENFMSVVAIFGGHFFPVLFSVVGKPSSFSALTANQFPEVTIKETGEKIQTTSPDELLMHGTLANGGLFSRSEEHTSELQSRGHLVCRLLLEKKKKKNN